MGTIGILILAEKKGLIQSSKEELIKLRNKGFWISDKLLQRAS